MWIMGRGVVTAPVATMLVAGSAWADNNPNGAAFRAVGWFRGNEEITADQIKCEVPTVSSAISDGLYGMGLWNTFGIPNYFCPSRRTATPYGPGPSGTRRSPTWSGPGP